VPELIRLVESRDPIWRKALWATALKLLRNAQRVGAPLAGPEEYVIHSVAARALATIDRRQTRHTRLGTNAAQQGERASVGRSHGAGPHRQRLCAGFDRCGARCESDIRYAAIDGLAQLGAGAEPAIPALLERLKKRSR